MISPVKRASPQKHYGGMWTLFRSARISLAILAASCAGQNAGTHAIGVRVVNGAGELYDRLTGQRFTLRGNNFVRFAPQDAGSAGTIIYLSMFNVDRYNANDMEKNLRLMRQSGYNTVRVFLNQLAIGNPAGGLSGSYMNNVVDFLQRAKSHGIYTILTVDDYPH